jgi:hypothetical protein
MVKDGHIRLLPIHVANKIAAGEHMIIRAGGRGMKVAGHAVAPQPMRRTLLFASHRPGKGRQTIPCDEWMNCRGRQ